tara:strand:- start:971 stop:1375 length:405 start_codon:yes stop_codon:yes gene_type:complete
MENGKSNTAYLTGEGMVYPPVKVRTSGKDVIASSSVNTFSYDNLEIEIAQFKFIFNFINSGAEQKIEYRNKNPTTLIIDLYNFNNSIGTGVGSPIKIGTLMGRELYLGFMVYAMSPVQSKQVHYTFMLGDKDDD